MGTDKRERQKANKAAKLEAERAAAKRAQQVATIKRVAVIAVIVIIGMVLISALTGCGSSDGASDGGDASSATTAAPDEQPCETTPDGVRQTTFDEAPTFELTDGTTYTATFETSQGTVVVDLDTERTPETTANFIALANACYYDGTELFRTEAQSGIIQGGGALTNDNTDPGPGYTIEDEGGTFTAEDYAPGTIAMARTQAPDSASSQFFFLANEGGRYLGDPSQLGPSAGTYVVFGQTTEGLDVLVDIANLESAPGTGVPSTPVTIESVRISES